MNKLIICLLAVTAINAARDGTKPSAIDASPVAPNAPLDPSPPKAPTAPIDPAAPKGDDTKPQPSYPASYLPTSYWDYYWRQMNNYYNYFGRYPRNYYQSQYPYQSYSPAYYGAPLRISQPWYHPQLSPYNPPVGNWQSPPVQIGYQPRDIYSQGRSSTRYIYPARGIPLSQGQPNIQNPIGQQPSQPGIPNQATPGFINQQPAIDQRPAWVADSPQLQQQPPSQQQQQPPSQQQLQQQPQQQTQTQQARYEPSQQQLQQTVYSWQSQAFNLRQQQALNEQKLRQQLQQQQQQQPQQYLGYPAHSWPQGNGLTYPAYFN